MKKLIPLMLLTVLWISSHAQDSRVNNPIKNFDKLWTEFNNRYANFDQVSFDWNEKYKYYRKQLNQNSTNDELFEICCRMLQELDDKHVSINRKNSSDSLSCKELNPSRLEEEFPTNKEIFELINIDSMILKQNNFCTLIDYKTKKNEYPMLQYAFSSRLGYLRINGMAGYSKNKLNKIMLEVIDSLETKSGLILDVRFNGGGYDKFSYNIASFFTDKKRIGHHKKTRIKGTDKFTMLKTKYIIPRGDNQSTKPIIILTSNYTTSAADVFVMAMKEIPYVTTIGYNTSGFFSDMYEFKLPNKWEVSLSHQKYFDANMKNWERIGIEPDIKLINTNKNLQNQDDPLIVKAIELLTD